MRIDSKVAEKTRNKVVRASIKVLLKKGDSASVSIADICSSAGLTRPTFYRYFRSKRKLFESLHMAAIARDLTPHLEKAMSIIDPVERFRFMIRAFIRDIILTYPEIRVLTHEALVTKSKNLREVKTVWKAHYHLLRQTIEQLQSSNEISTDINPSWTALFVLGMLSWTTYWFDFSRKTSAEAVTDLAQRLIFNAVGLKTP